MRRIDFGLTFLICTLIMLFNEIWKLLGNRPEAFKYGSIIYQVIAVFSSIITNVAIGVAGAISFYYIAQLIDKKKNRELYTDLRKHLLFMFYNHLKLLTRLDQFREVNNRERRVADFYDIFDIPVFYDNFKKINSKEEVTRFKKNLYDYFATQSEQQIKVFTEAFEKDIKKLKEKSNIRFFKESKDLIDTVCIIYDDDFSMISSIYLSNFEDTQNKSNYIEELVKDYYDFLNATVILYEELEEFLESMDKNRWVVFIKMLD
ncbi:hypothetical protein ACWA16_13450 [Bacillus subtilis]|uniref:hypothetical protein n=1 Tax=Bacillus TaxID=1386 RepID=UPI001377AA80|nr:hypothetical protein [Bacillus subtilis]KAF1342938.1 hypothetical protein ABP1_3709 [Bacillus subtilis]MEC1490554.1 hypothetical protein [Bacillus subtilis]NRF02335.1 hypothetical protein [Bacillus subtilis]NRG36029.1 hypothetical protein [Bacillus subtilis]